MFKGTKTMSDRNYIMKTRKEIRNTMGIVATIGICVGAGLICFLNEITANPPHPESLLIITIISIAWLYKLIHTRKYFN